MTIAQPWMWAVFIVFVLLMLAIDLFVFGGKKAHKVSVKEAAIWSVVWVSLALAFNALLYWYLNGAVGNAIATQKATEFLTGYVIEKSLSVDNVFVFLMIFTAFNVAPENQRRVLLYGVLGAIVLRAVMILAGAWVVSEFKWMLYVFGVFLVLTGVRMLFSIEKTNNLQQNAVVKIVRKYLNVTDDFHGAKFSITQNGKRYFTPLFLVLLLIEASDVVFAVDSIPAIFAITTDPFIVFTSNIFAIMGLRALYFLLADMAERFHLLKYGLAILLIFIGGKMLAAYWFHVPTNISLIVIVTILATSVVASLVTTRANKPLKPLS